MEGFGIVVLEAGAAGLPVVAAALEGLQDAIQDGVNGVLVASEDAAGFADAVEDLLDDEAARTSLGRSAAQHVRGAYAWSTIAARYLELIQDSVERAHDAVPEPA